MKEKIFLSYFCAQKARKVKTVVPVHKEKRIKRNTTKVGKQQARAVVVFHLVNQPIASLCDFFPSYPPIQNKHIYIYI